MTETRSKALYDDEAAARSEAGAPHLAHPSLRRLFATLAREAYTHASAVTPRPRGLDLGAGQGAATLAFLKLGAHVTVVDDSESQLRLLREGCASHTNDLEVLVDDAVDVVDRLGGSYEIVAASSFLHHVPDDLDFARRATTVALQEESS